MPGINTLYPRLRERPRRPQNNRVVPACFEPELQVFC
jgi:hypothetical protein